MRMGSQNFGAASVVGSEFGEGRAGPAKTVQEHIAKLPLLAIAGGMRAGSCRRWAEDFITKNQDDPQIDMLRSHLRGVKACEALSHGGVVAMSGEDLLKNLSELKLHEVEPDTCMKMDLISREVRLWCSDPNRFASIGQMLKIVTPWLELADADQEAPSFDPMHPKLSCVEGSSVEKSSVFSEILISTMLVPLVKAGNAGMTEVRTPSLRQWSRTFRTSAKSMMCMESVCARS